MPLPNRDEHGRFSKGASSGTLSGGALGEGPSQGHQKGSSQSQQKGPSQGPSGSSVISSEAELDLEEGLVRGVGEVAAASRFYRKRPSTVVRVSGSCDSDTEVEGVVSKVSTARRGKGKTGRSGPSRDVVVPTPVPTDEELERCLTARQYFKKPAAKLAEDGTTGTESEVAVGTDLGVLNAQELRAHAGEGIACILEVARKSGNLKGEFVGRLKRSASALREVVDVLAGRSEAEETRRLRADNGRLRLELESCKAEVKALRRGSSEAKAKAATASASVAAGVASAPQGLGVSLGEVVEDLKKSLTMTFGQMLNARLEGLEGRLLPAQTVRPPLRADVRRAYAAVAAPAPQPAQPVRPAPPPVRQPTQPARPVGQPARQAASSASLRDAGKAVPAPPATTAGPSTAAADPAWTVVGKKKRKGGKGGGASSAPPSSSAIKLKPAVSALKKVALKAPTSAAVVLALQPAAVEKGATYSALLAKAQQEVNITELGIDQLRFRQTATGARILEIPGSQSGEKADRLAEKLRGVLSDVASVTRPVKSADLRVADLDDAASKESVAAALAKLASCDVQLVKVGELRPAGWGTRAAIVTLPVTAAKALISRGRLLIGWSSVRVTALGARPMRCFRCMGLGHTRPQCPAVANRGDLCFQCGGTGHRAAECEKAAPRCVVCVEAGKPADHKMGSRICAPPKIKGKAVGTTAFQAVATAQRGGRQAASEEAVMSE